MNWTPGRAILKASNVNYDDLHKKSNVSNQNRLKILKENLYTCRTCGGTYKSYLMMDLIKDKEQRYYDTYCRACYTITHLNSGVSDNIEIYQSTMSQIDIVKNTIDYIINNNRLPKPIEIDSKIIHVPISALEYIILLNHINPPNFENYKIFFSDRFNTNFINQNYNNMMFVDETINDDTNNIACGEIQEYSICQNDIDVLNDKFRK